jgi:hypothetical protein
LEKVLKLRQEKFKKWETEKREEIKFLKIEKKDKREKNPTEKG